MSDAQPTSDAHDRTFPAVPWHRWLLFRLLGWYPPYLGAGVRVVRVARDLSAITVRMKLRFYNRNYVGTHFGGSLYSMCDPFYMLMLIERMGRDYIVWDKAATVRFRRPGRGTVWARFHLPDDEVLRLRDLADRHDKVEPTFTVDVTDAGGKTIAEVEKLLYVRRKDRGPKRTAG